jgi:hypothetical protein
MKIYASACLLICAITFVSVSVAADTPPPASDNSAPAAGPAEIKLDDAHSDPILGDYTVAPGAKMTISREDGRLYTQLPGQPKFELGATSDTEFFLRNVPVQLTFAKGPDGKVTSVTVHQNGQTQEWPKAQ